MRRLQLTEYQTAQAVPLSPGERDGLRRAAPSIAVTPTLGSEGRYDLTPGSQVGAICLPTLAVEVRPKLPLDRVLFLISYALAPVNWAENLFDFTEASVVEAIIPAFLVQVRRAFQRGVLRGYRTYEDALPTVRGRVRFADQLRRRFGRFPPAEVRYNEFTADIEVNRLIRAAAVRLGRMPIRSSRNRQALGGLRAALSGVSDVEYHPWRLPEIHYDRLNNHYRPAVELARFVLRSLSFELDQGRLESSAFLVDMNQVFEDFVVVALREALGASTQSFLQGCRGRRLCLDERGIVKLQPDLSWWDGLRCTFVGDVKYKTANADGVEHADLYQLLAYTVAANLPGGLLVYAAGNRGATMHRIVYANKELTVIALELAGQPEAILAQINALANRVVSIRCQALATLPLHH